MKNNEITVIRITYLILAHKIPSQTTQLIRVLAGPGIAFVVHVDNSVPLDGFTESFKDLTDVFMITERSSSIWGSFGLVEASLNGLKYIARNTPTERVVLISGQDYPIKPQKYISSYFSKNTETIFISYFKLPRADRPGGGLWRLPNSPRPKSAEIIYSGSQWWSFPIKTVSFILQYLEENPDFIAYFRNVFIPDESFFQTLLLNCKVDFVTQNVVNTSLKLIKWDPPYMHPRVLTLADQNIILKSKNLFARKFDPIESRELLDLIDTVLLDKKDNLHTEANEKKQAILFLTNHSDEILLERYHELCDQAKVHGEVKLLFHKKKEEHISKGLDEIKPFVFTNSILSDMGYPAIAETLLPGSNHFPLLKFYMEYPDYDYYWLIEDDVRYPPGWGNFFGFLSEAREDFLSCHLKEYTAADPKWHWWQSITYKQRSVSDSIKIKSFNPIYRISNSAMEFLHHCLSNGWSGHHEVLIPTLLKMGGFSMGNLGGVGPYTSDRLQNKFYIERLDSQTGETSLESMRFRPLVTQQEMIGPFLYHPVKNICMVKNDAS
jgi:hypothetical protein